MLVATLSAVSLAACQGRQELKLLADGSLLMGNSLASLNDVASSGLVTPVRINPGTEWGRAQWLIAVLGQQGRGAVEVHVGNLSVLVPSATDYCKLARRRTVRISDNNGRPTWTVGERGPVVGSELVTELRSAALASKSSDWILECHEATTMGSVARTLDAAREAKIDFKRVGILEPHAWVRKRRRLPLPGTNAIIRYLCPADPHIRLRPLTEPLTRYARAYDRTGPIVEIAPSGQTFVDADPMGPAVRFGKDIVVRADKGAPWRSFVDVVLRCAPGAVVSIAVETDPSIAYSTLETSVTGLKPTRDIPLHPRFVGQVVEIRRPVKDMRSGVDLRVVVQSGRISVNERRVTSLNDLRSVIETSTKPSKSKCVRVVANESAAFGAVAVVLSELWIRGTWFVCVRAQ